MKILLIAWLLFAVGFLTVHAGEKDSDLDRLQGTWLVVSLTEKGKAVPADEIAVLEFVIQKDLFTVTEKGKTVVQYRIKLDPTKSPRLIDFTHEIGTDKGKTEPGVYVFDKDLLKLSLNEERKERPSVFEGKETEAYSVIVLKKKAK